MSLESLRKLRVQAEEVITMELAQITQGLAHMEQRCQTLDAKIQAEAETYCLQTEQGMAIEYVLEWHGRLDAQHAALKEARHAVAALAEAWDQTRARLVEASQERRILDRLADRQQQAHVSKLRRREQHATDEAANRQRFSAGEGLS
jgi:flagellar export protein FliJ